jgi:hypothetical protein
VPLAGCGFAHPEKEIGKNFVAGPAKDDRGRAGDDAVHEKAVEVCSGGRCGMSEMIAWIAAEADAGEIAGKFREDGDVESRKPESQNPRPPAKCAGRTGQPDFGTQQGSQNPHFSQTAREVGHPSPVPVEDLPVHQFAAQEIQGGADENPLLVQDSGNLVDTEYCEEDYETEKARRIYRGRTVAMLRKYMRYSIETGRLPSLLGREFFRTQVTSYTVVTFEDRVIFVHDMERCLEKLDEFSRQIIARHILQEHDRWATARLLHCNEKTIRRLTPMALDVLSEILLEVGLLERLDTNNQKSCQGGLRRENSVSDCEEGKNKF